MTPEVELAQFLLYRIAEDAEVAERCIARNAFGEVTSWHPYRHQVTEADLPRGSVAVPAPGFLAECEAKRGLIRDAGDVPTISMRRALKWLALPYVDHPDYRDEWRP